MTTDWYDRQGNPVNRPELATSVAGKHVAKDTIGDVYVSTIHLGLDHNFTNDGPPLIFETMVFPNGEWNDLACFRYSTEQEAIEGHARVVALIREHGWTADYLERHGIEEDTDHDD